MNLKSIKNHFQLLQSIVENDGSLETCIGNNHNSISMESDRRRNQFSFDFTVDGKQYYCEWHLKYRSGLRIHFCMSERGGEKVIQVGYIGPKITT